MSRAEGLRWPVRPPPLLTPAKEEAAVLRPGDAATAAISESLGAKGSREKVATAADLVGDANGLSGRLCSALQWRETTRRVKKGDQSVGEMLLLCVAG